MADQVDIAVIGGGIVGLAAALALSGRGRYSLALLEAEAELAAHQTGHNSGVIHSGLYYRPGSLKAQNCTRGREALYRFCETHNIPHERCGKIVVATRPEELSILDNLAERGRANGLKLRRLSAEELREHEPHAAGIAGLWVPETGIVDYREVAQAYARQIETNGGQIRLRSRVRAVQREGGRLRLESASGEISARLLINCAGLQADRLAELLKDKFKVMMDRGLELITVRHYQQDVLDNLRRGKIVLLEEKIKDKTVQMAVKDVPVMRRKLVPGKP